MAQINDMDGRTDPNLADLVACARSSDADALSRLLSACQAAAYHQALAILHDPHRAADVTQESLIAAYLGLASLREPRLFSHWLAGIVRHQCHRILRRNDLEWIPLASALPEARFGKGSKP